MIWSLNAKNTVSWEILPQQNVNIIVGINKVYKIENNGVVSFFQNKSKINFICDRIKNELLKELILFDILDILLIQKIDKSNYDSIYINAMK